MRVCLLASCLVALAVMPSPAQDAVTPTLHTVSLDDTLENVIKQLKDEHSIVLSADQVLLSTRVVVELQDATELEVLEAICRQVGAVYDAFGIAMPGRPQQYRLREGDWDTDPRPQAQVGDYLVTVHEVAVRQVWRVSFRWGDAEPGGGDAHTLQVQFNVTPASDLAQQKLGALRLARAVYDTGEEVEPPNAMEQWGHQHRFHSMRPWQSGVFATPPEGATGIAELHGVLGLYSAVVKHVVEFGPEELDVAKPLGKAQARLLACDPGTGEVTIAVDEQTTRPYYLDIDTDVQVQLLDADGAQVATGSANVRGRSTDQGGRRTTWEDDGVKEMPATIRVERTDREEPLTDLPFVIEDIPLP